MQSNESEEESSLDEVVSQAPPSKEPAVIFEEDEGLDAKEEPPSI